MNINVYSQKQCGLEVFIVTVNGVQVAQYLSRQLAMTRFVILRQKYQGLVK